MKNVKLLALLMGMLLCLPATLLAREIPAVVTTGWLEKNLGNPDLKVIDIRKVEEYKAGHIPGAVNVFYGTWAVKTPEFDNELPENDDLLDIVNGAALTPKSLIVVAGKVDNPTEQANITRVAWTLRYAGFANVAFLDGGYNQWSAEKKPLATDAPPVKAADNKPAFVKQIKAYKEQVLSKRDKATLVDARLPEFFFGAAKLPFVERPGRIKGAVNLPTAWLFTKEGTLRSTDEIRAMANGVVGTDPGREIIVYCDTGRLASAWWFILSEMLGYKNVSMYDGSSQEFSRDARFPMDKFTWK